MKFVSSFGEVYPVMFICLIVVAGIHLRKGWILLNIVAFTTFLTVWAKETVDYPRPVAVDSSLQSYGQEITSKQLSHLQPKGFLDVFSSELLNLTRTSDVGRYGFPSGHTSGQFAIWIGLALLFRKKWLTILAITFVLLTMLSRMYLGVHYLGDVLGGLILGTMVTFPIYLFGSYLDGQHYSRSFIFGLLILLPLLSLESSGNWQASLLLGLNCTYLMFNMSGQLKLSNSTKHRALNSLVLIFIFLSGFTLVRALTKDLATLIEVISMFLLGTGVFSFQLFLARKTKWIVRDEQ